MTAWEGLNPPYSTIVADPPWEYPGGAKGSPRVVQRWEGFSVLSHPRPGAGKHSTKPDVFGDLIETCCPGPYVELFARAPRLGWDSWGYGYEIGASA